MQASVLDWRATLTFSDRLEVVSNLIESYQTAFVKASPTEASSESQILENDIYENAISRQAYDDRVESVRAELVGNAPTKHVQDLKQHAAGEASDAIGVDFGTYKNARHYRDGLFSSIYKANLTTECPPEWRILSNMVALKVTVALSMEEAPHNSRRETRLLRRAQSENVIPLLEYFKYEGDRLVMVFPFMQYELTDQLDQSHSIVERISWMRDALAALEFLHEHGIIHRDVKPANLLLRTAEGPLYLADFGIAWCQEDSDSEPHENKITDVGTTSYRPPELLFGNKRYTTALDIWAAGCTAAEIFGCTKETLFKSGDVGSELALIQSIFQSLGTPTTETWPEASSYPDWGKMQFHSYPPKPWSELMPNATGEARDFVSKLVCFESGTRLTARQALDDEFLRIEKSWKN